MMSKSITRTVLFASVLFLGSCGSGSGSLEADLSLALSPYQVLDLTTGTMTGRISVPDIQTNVAYRQNLMVFRLIPSGNTAVGTATGSLGAGIDPTAGQTSVSAFYCAVFEVTQGQWSFLSGGGSQPWASVVSVPAAPSLGSTSTDDELPAFAVSTDLLTVALASHNTGKAYRLEIPTGIQWERACRSGTSTSFFWGSNPNDRTTAANYAVVHETAQGLNGPQKVGERLPNAFGLFDTHGNVWEITNEGLTTTIRGGSWRDPLSLSRAAYGVGIDQFTRHALVGARLVLVP